jgi:hypothetical protein
MLQFSFFENWGLYVFYNLEILLSAKKYTNIRIKIQINL